MYYSVGRMPGSRRAKLCLYTLALALGLSAQGAGAVHSQILAGYVLLVLASGYFALTWRKTSGWLEPRAGKAVPSAPGSARSGERGAGSAGSLRECVGIAVWICLAIYSLLQALPLPLGWVARLAPDNADIWARALEPFNVPAPSFASISIAPGRTLVEAVKFASYAVVFAVSARLSRLYGVRVVALLVFASALAVALVTALHQLAGAERLFGLYAPKDATDVAPLLNPNNRAGYLNLGFFCGLGLLFRYGREPRGILCGLGLVLLVTESLMAQSRAGTACLVLGMVLALATRRSSRGAREFGRAVQLGLVLLIGASGALMMLSARRKGGLGFEDQSLEKLDLIQRSAVLARDHWLTGVGRGGFGSVFSAYQSPGFPKVYEHAENLPLQWAAEWGVPVAVVALAALAWVLAPVLSRRTFAGPVRRCVLVGAVVLLLQNLVDLGLEIPAIAAALVSLAGALCGGLDLAKVKPAPAELAGRLLTAGAALSVVTLGLALALGSDSPARERDRLRGALVEARGAPSESFWSELREARLAYPADPYFPLLGAAGALAAGQNALPWVARALERGPASGSAHLYLARALAARGAKRQALGALREAVTLDPTQSDTAIQLATRWDPTALAEIVPRGPAGIALLRSLAARSRDPAQRLEWLTEVLERDPDDSEAHLQVAHELHAALTKPDAGVCRGRHEWCLNAVVDHARRGARPGDPRAAILEAKVLERRSGPAAAEAHLAAVCSALPSNLECFAELAALAITNGSARASEAVNAAAALGCATRERCGQTHYRLGEQFARVGQWHNAASHFQHAARELPSAAAYRALAQAARQLGQEGRATDALRRAELLEAAAKPSGAGAAANVQSASSTTQR